MRNNEPQDEFIELVNNITNIGRQWHSERLLKHARENSTKINKTLREISLPSGDKAGSGIVISAGPSVLRKNSIKRISESDYTGAVIAVDGAYIACLRDGLIPDYVITLDPHPTRIVRWFGDRDFEKNTKHDDYFERQDLDIEFRKNSIEKNDENIEFVNKYGHLSKAVVATSSPKNVVARIQEARFDTYWWNPLVDDPNDSGSLSRELYRINRVPCMNTGGTVGTAAWVFASAILKLPRVAVVGMDFGYYSDTPLNMTQTYHELAQYAESPDEVKKYFRELTFPLTGEKFFTDPTYYWYRKNFLQLYQKTSNITVNCTEGGTLFDENLECMYLNDFLSEFFQKEWA